jgi:hypothetical protein
MNPLATIRSMKLNIVMAIKSSIIVKPAFDCVTEGIVRLQVTEPRNGDSLASSVSDSRPEVRNFLPRAGKNI